MTCMELLGRDKIGCRGIVPNRGWRPDASTGDVHHSLFVRAVDLAEHDGARAPRLGLARSEFRRGR